MDIIGAIKTRRSIRDYKKREVSFSLLKKIVECGLHAPSSKNSQPWNFLIIKNKKIINQIADILINSKNLDAEPSDPQTGKIRAGFMSSIKASGYIIKGTPSIIVVENTCPFSHQRKEVMKSKFKGNAINGHDSEVISIGCAIQNICLAAHGLGLSSVIIADVVAEEKIIKNLLGIKGDLIAVLPIGYPPYKPGPKKVNPSYRLIK